MNSTQCRAALSAILLTAAARLAGQGAGCADTRFPTNLSSASALLDSAHAIADLGVFADPSKPMIFSVYFMTGDSVAHVRALEANDAAAAVSLTNYVRHAPAREFWAFRVRISGGDSPALTLERSKYCPPAPQGGDPGRVAVVSGSVAVVGMPELPARGPSRVMVTVEALIAEDGRVVRARVLQTSGNTEVDADIVGDMKRHKFAPANLDGQPIEAVFRSGGESPRP